MHSHGILQAECRWVSLSPIEDAFPAQVGTRLHFVQRLSWTNQLRAMRILKVLMGSYPSR